MPGLTEQVLRLTAPTPQPNQFGLIFLKRNKFLAAQLMPLQAAGQPGLSQAAAQVAEPQAVEQVVEQQAVELRAVGRVVVELRGANLPWYPPTPATTPPP